MNKNKKPNTKMTHFFIINIMHVLYNIAFSGILKGLAFVQILSHIIIKEIQS